MKSHLKNLSIINQTPTQFNRIGQGSIGGKAESLLLLHKLLQNSDLHSNFPQISIYVPHSIIICSDEFDRFLKKNKLLNINFDFLNDADINRLFLISNFSESFHSYVKIFLQNFKAPLAVRSSGLLEDSSDRPFAGIYRTLMLPNNSKNSETNLVNLLNAIKLVYASTYLKAARAYHKTNNSNVHNEKMAVIVQEVVGQQYGTFYYPTFSGVAQSYSFYPISFMKPDDGVVNVALGLGMNIVNGGNSIQFSPRFPKIVPQLSSEQSIEGETQKCFFAINLNKIDTPFELLSEDRINMVNLSHAKRHGSLYFVSDPPEFQNITFSPILKDNIFPLAKLVQHILDIGKSHLNRPVEIEFSANLRKNENEKSEFALLQMRPFSKNSLAVSIDSKQIREDEILIRASSSLGNGEIKNIYDLVFIKPELFNPIVSTMIAKELGKINESIQNSDRTYILICPGRLGSLDVALGIPATWDQISGVKIIVEISMEGLNIEPSQGSHFFKNIASFEIGFACINPKNATDFIDYQWLENNEPYKETEYVLHFRFDTPLVTKIDSHNRLMIITKPGKNN